MEKEPGVRLAVVGVREVGGTMIDVLKEREFPADSLVPFARTSGGRTFWYDGSYRPVQPLAEANPEDFDLVLMSAGKKASGEWAPRFVEAGARVIDNSPRWRLVDGVPLTVLEINGDELTAQDGIISVPNCVTIPTAQTLKPIQVEFGLAEAHVTALQSVSGTGERGRHELNEQERAWRGWGDATPRVYPHKVHRNVQAAGKLRAETGWSAEEEKIVPEMRKVLDQPDLVMTVTTFRVGVDYGHTMAVTLRTDTEADPSEVRELLEEAPGVVVMDRPEVDYYPTPLQAAGKDEAFVGRIRRAENDMIQCVIVADNVRNGAATPAVQTAQALHARGLLG